MNVSCVVTLNLVDITISSVNLGVKIMLIVTLVLVAGLMSQSTATQYLLSLEFSR